MLFNNPQIENLVAILTIQRDQLKDARIPHSSPMWLSWALMVRELHIIHSLRDNTFVDRFRADIEPFFDIERGAMNKLYLNKKENVSV